MISLKSIFLVVVCCVLKLYFRQEIIAIYFLNIFLFGPNPETFTLIIPLDKIYLDIYI